MSIEITLFTNIRNIEQPIYKDVASVLERIKSGSSRDLIKRIRETDDKAEKADLKSKLPSICFSGKFTKRTDDSLVEHSGLICLDFDKYDRRTEMYDDKEVISKSKYTFAVFISPSGYGLKVIVKIPKDPAKHKNYFNALQDHYKSKHFDTTSRNISRVCYESYDPAIYVNYDSVVWEDAKEEEFREVSVINPVLPITSEDRIAEILVKWWVKNYPMVEGQRNNSAFTLAMSLNEFGVSKTYATMVLSQYSEADFTSSEINKVIDSAYDKHRDKFHTKYYEDSDKMGHVKNQIKNGEPRGSIKSQLESSGVSGELAEAVIEKIEYDASQIEFWTINDKGVVKIVPYLFKKYLEDNGFYKFYPANSTKHVFVKVTNNLIDNTTVEEIKDFVLSGLIEMNFKGIYNYFAESTKYFKEEFLTLLSPIDVFFIDDTKTTSYLYFRNCALQISTNGVQQIDYIDLGGYVWRSHIIDRLYTNCEYKGSDFQKFVRNICKNDDGRVESLESTIGYLLHGYKRNSYSPAVIFNDEVISDNPEGGTGKGLLMSGISKLKKVVILNGKQFDSAKSFAYQLVSADTQILCFDDVKKSFNFELLFSDITEGITLEKKNKDAIKIPFEKSPKIAITTNYAIKGKGNSFERRKWELEFFNYYRMSFTPEDEFGRMMFSDWNDDDWCQFDIYMIGCLQRYLSTGLVKSKFVNLDIRKLSAETSHEFIEYCGLINNNNPSNLMARFLGYEAIYKKDLFDDFVNFYPDFAPRAKRTISRSQFGNWLVSFAVFREGVLPVQERDSSGQWIRLIKNLETYTQEKMNV